MRRAFIALLLVLNGCATTFEGDEWLQYYSGMEWVLNLEQRTIFYGVNESDVIVAAISCEGDPSRLTVTYWSTENRKPRRHERIVVSSSESRRYLPAVSEPDHESGQLLFNAELPREILISWAGQRVRLGVGGFDDSPPQPLPAAHVEKLFNRCGLT
jgi:hypothetical protein